MNADYVTITMQLIGALIAGAAIGFERSYHARPAGFRTHTLVCVASCLLMLITLYQWRWLPPGTSLDAFRTDSTRMAQGIMTGIGFLGAGVIFKEGLTVRGLTTAASIWITAAVGIMIGISFYYPALLATLLALGILSLLRWFEAKIPAQSYAQYSMRFDRENTMPEDEVRALLKKHGFTVANMSYQTTDSGSIFEYRMVIHTTNVKNTALLAEYLRRKKGAQRPRLRARAQAKNLSSP